MKVIPIEEAKYVSTIKVYELIGSLLTFEITIHDKFEKKIKGVAFKVDIIDNDD